MGRLAPSYVSMDVAVPVGRLPDLLDELEWGMNWALDMQDPADGGVYFRVASATWDGVSPSSSRPPRQWAWARRRRHGFGAKPGY